MNVRLKELRKGLDLSQETFGEKLGVTKASISRLESGINNLTDQMVNLICKTFNVNESWLRTGKGDMFIETDESVIEAVVQEYHLDNFGREFLRVFVELSPEQQEAVKKIAYSMLAAVKKNETLSEEFHAFQTETSMEMAQEPIYGTEEWADRQAELYKQELIIESHEKTSAALHDIKEA